MKYIVQKAVKDRAKQLGYRTSKSFLHMLDVTVETILESMVLWTKPMKTYNGENLAYYLGHHKISGGKQREKKSRKRRKGHGKI